MTESVTVPAHIENGALCLDAPLPADLDRVEVRGYRTPCGMLHVPSYRRRWEEKLDWYRTHGIVPREEGSGENGRLIITRNDANGSIDSAKISKLIADILCA